MYVYVCDSFVGDVQEIREQ